MRKIKIVIGLLVTACGFLSLAVSPVKATLLTIDKKGEIVWKVLASEDANTLPIPQRSSLEIKEVKPSGEQNINNQISLKIEDGKMQLSVATEEGEKNLDVTNTKGELIEIEERPQLKLIKVGTLGDKFSIEQEGVTALTIFPIKINPKTAELSLETSSGSHFLAVMPADAYQISLKAKVVSQLVGDSLAIEENKPGQISYLIEAKKKINFLNFFEYDFPIKVSVSALTGEILNVEQPIWQKIVGFIFS
jgi:hypothetical protein